MRGSCGTVYNENVARIWGIAARAEAGVATVGGGEYRAIKGGPFDRTETAQMELASRLLPWNDRSHGLSRVAPHVAFDLRPNESTDAKCGCCCRNENQEGVDSPHLPEE